MSRPARWPSVLALAVTTGLLLGACSLGDGPQPAVALANNACANEVPPTPTPSDSTATPTPTGTPIPPTATPTPPGSVPTPTPTPGPTVDTRTSLVPPDEVLAWAEAIVVVSEPRDSGWYSEQSGLVVEADGGVLTVFRVPPRDGLRVTVDGRTLPATVEAYDPLTGAALLRVEAVGLTVASLEDVGGVADGGERVLAVWRDPGNEGLAVQGMTAVQDTLSPDDLFALRVNSGPLQPRMGSVVVTLDGRLVGLAGSDWQWVQSLMYFGGGFRFTNTHAAVLLESGLELRDGERPNAPRIPGAVAYHGEGWGATDDSPVTRQSVADPVAEVLASLGGAVEIEFLGGPPRFWDGSGTVLELLYHEPQELRNEDGEILGSGRYIALWWRR